MPAEVHIETSKTPRMVVIRGVPAARIAASEHENWAFVIFFLLNKRKAKARTSVLWDDLRGVLTAPGSTSVRQKVASGSGSSDPGSRGASDCGAGALHSRYPRGTEVHDAAYRVVNVVTTF